MRQVKRKGGFIHIYSPGETWIPGEINFFEEEYEWTRKQTYSLREDVEALGYFWGTVFEKKLADPNYSIYQDFPKDLGPKKFHTIISEEILNKLRGKIATDKCE